MSGLSAVEVLASRAEHGTNVLTPPPRIPWWQQYFGKFDDPIIRILLIAAGLAIAIGAIDGHVAEGIGILVAIFLATFLAFWNEYRAAREFDVLNTASDDLPVTVLRDGGFSEVPRREVVVGDILFLDVGEEVPADALITEVVGLYINEAKLTGEAMPVEKKTAEKVFRGTIIADGNGRATVTAVGDRTEIGCTLRESIVDTGIETPLNRQLAKLSRIIGVIGFAAAALVFFALFASCIWKGSIVLSRSEWIILSVIGFGMHVALLRIWLPIVYDAAELLGFHRQRPNWLEGGSRTWAICFGAGMAFIVASSALGILLGVIPAAPDEWLHLADVRQLLRNFMIAVTIIVVAVPEGLAMSVTLSLAFSMRKMAASNTLIRRLHACETIGAATVICSDKTGTLTLNEMRVTATVLGTEPLTALPSTPHLRRRLIEAFAVNSTAHLSREAGQPVRPVGNPTEGALLLWLEDQGVDYQEARDGFPVVIQWIFSTERKFMATLGPVLHVKGAPEIILDRCNQIATADSPSPLTVEDRQMLSEVLLRNQSRGMRTLAMAYRELPPGEGDLEALFDDMVWLGLVAIADPVRADVPGAIAACRTAGVEVKIVTGDNVETAREIARQVGLGEIKSAVTGTEFAAMSEADASEAAANLQILARARPADKLRLVRLLKTRGEVVAVTGDGVNDGPALNYADVGLAMGRTGTAVAREASDIILLDDSFPSIVSAVRWGRSLYENIQRFILFQLTINVVALGLAVLGPFLGYELPLTVMQMLWVNLIMDTFAALALATEPPHDDVLKRSPRSPQAFIVTPGMARAIFGVGAIFIVVLLGFILYSRDTGQLFNDDSPSRAGTMLFTIFVLLQFWNLFNAKAMARRGSVLRSLGNNPSFLAIAAVILLGQFLLVQFGGTVFRTIPLDLADWMTLLGVTSMVLVIGEIVRLFRLV